MQRIFSTRLDEGTLDELDRLTRKLRMTKRRFVEEAIHLRARQAEEAAAEDVWSETLGAWKRVEQPAVTIRRARAAFRRSFKRHQRESRARLHR